MTLFIRNTKNETIVDVELYKTNKIIELHSAINIDTYSRFLLENLDRKSTIIGDFSFLAELRGWLWESYFGGSQNNIKEYDRVVEQVTRFMKNIANEYNLYFITD